MPLFLRRRKWRGTPKGVGARDAPRMAKESGVERRSETKSRVYKVLDGALRLTPWSSEGVTSLTPDPSSSRPTSPRYRPRRFIE